MKKFVLLLVVSFITPGLLAQDMEESSDGEETEVEVEDPFYIGGSFSFSTSENISSVPLLNIFGIFPPNFPPTLILSAEDIESTSFSVFPTFGKALSDRWSLGATLGYSHINSEEEELSLEQNTNRYSIAMFSRYYFNPEDQLTAHMQPYIRYISTNSSTEIPGFEEDEVSTNSYQLGVRAGALYSVSEHLRVTTSVGLIRYLTGSREMEDDPGMDEETDFNSFDMNLNLSTIQLGLEFTL